MFSHSSEELKDAPPPARLALWLGAIAFYTSLPIPVGWPMAFSGIAAVAPTIGLGIGGILGLLDWGLLELGMPVWTRSALVVVGWVALTGGLHLDGAMDTADGLAVMDPERRLQVMADSVTGAFGAMSAIALLLLKVMALGELSIPHSWGLMLAAGWGRWGQLLAIVQYPYLKPTGKGAFHKAAVRSPWVILPSGLLLLGLSLGWGMLMMQGEDFSNWGLVLKYWAVLLSGGAIAWATGAWFHRKLGGHTGDTYGAVVEWTEALFLPILTLL